MKLGINTFTLKMIAIVAMLLDHIGAVLLPQYIILRMIGRIAYPIFAYTLAEGFVHTHDVKKYMMRMGILALLSEVPFDLAFFGKPLEFGHQNVFFTLFLGLVMMYLMSKAPITLRGLLCMAIIMALGEFLRTDYGMMGLFMIYWFYQYRDSKAVKAVWIACINVFLMGGVQAFAVLALIPIALHNGKQGPKWKGFFYGFYPVHLLLIYLLSMIL